MLQAVDPKLPDFGAVGGSGARIAGLERRKNRSKAEGIAPLWTPGFSRISPGPGVDMRPGNFWGNEALKKQGRVDRARHRVAGSVGHVGDVALQMLVVRLPQREAPDRVVDFA